ncbi:MAG: hypothetical protein AABW73_02405 [Nanoarchaeota archaeon]
MKKSREFSISTIILLVILSIRAIIQLFGAVTLYSPLFTPIFFLLAALYIVAIIGIIKKHKWGLISSFIVAVIDVMIALSIGGAASLGAGIIDLTIIFLTYKEYKK